VHPDALRARPPDVSLGEKVAFLSRRDAYEHCPDEIVVRETHMSWVFLAGSRVYKLKKPVRFPYLDFSTLFPTRGGLPRGAGAQPKACP
jgi:uncharacterized protein